MDIERKDVEAVEAEGVWDLGELEEVKADARLRTERLNKLRDHIRAYLETAITNPTIRAACVEEIIMLAESAMTMQGMVLSDAKIRKTPTVFEQTKREIDEWWTNLFVAAVNLLNDAMLRFIVYRILMEGLNSLASLCSSGKAIAQQLFRVKHKRQPMLSRANALAQAVIEAYQERHMNVKGRELQKELTPLQVESAWRHRKKVKPTVELLKQICRDCKFLIGIMKEYSWSGIQLLDECKTSRPKI